MTGCCTNSSRASSGGWFPLVQSTVGSRPRLLDYCLLTRARLVPASPLPPKQAFSWLAIPTPSVHPTPRSLRLNAGRQWAGREVLAGRTGLCRRGHLAKRHICGRRGTDAWLAGGGHAAGARSRSRSADGDGVPGTGGGPRSQRRRDPRSQRCRTRLAGRAAGFLSLIGVLPSYRRRLRTGAETSSSSQVAQL
jgi:hypothetical protein